MSAWLAVLLWAVAASLLHVRDRRQLVHAARARHEVRGPLCTAQLALDGLERSARVEAIGLELRRAALALDDLAARPRRDVTPVVDVARRRRASFPVVDAARRRRESFPVVDAARVLADAALVWRSLAAAHGAALSVEPSPARVAGDPLRLTQACANLVANAVEHGGGHVRVTSSAAGGRVRIEVADLGGGLPAPLPELVATARGRRSPRGHGLAIAAAIAERHGGRLIQIPEARGTHLVLDLPEAPTARQRSSRAHGPPSSPTDLSRSSRAHVPPSSPTDLSPSSRAHGPRSSS
jgi:signal transduction histidine kinase